MLHAIRCILKESRISVKPTKATTPHLSCKVMLRPSVNRQFALLPDTRQILTSLCFIVGCLIYERVFAVVGYMYEIAPTLSISRSILSLILLWILLAFSRFSSNALRHAIDVLILGIYMPISVMYSLTNYSHSVLLIPFASLIVNIVSIRIFLSTRFFKALATPGYGLISIDLFKKLTLLLFCLFSSFLFASYGINLNMDIVQTYFDAYTIRAENVLTGLAGYIAGWFPLVFIPILWDSSPRSAKAFERLLLAFGVLTFYQAFAVKLVFLQFLLLVFFSFLYQKRFFKVAPQLFFNALLLLSFIIGPPLYPLLDRFFFIVGLNSIYYFDYFGKNDLRFFEGTSLDLGLSSYNLEPGLIIDGAYYQGLGTNQSAGYLPTIFSDLGIWGVLLASVAIGAIIVILFSLETADARLSYILLISFSFSLMNYSLPMMVFSGGLIFIFLIACLCKRPLYFEATSFSE